jgi:pre-rRNA-processing protein TSR2
MASATNLPGPSVINIQTPSPGIFRRLTCYRNCLTFCQEKCQAHFELGVTLSLFFWPSLSLAVTNHWGGPDSADKREWFASATIDLLNETPDADDEYVETFLLQVMLDEFEVNVDDESGFEVAEQILRLRKDCEKGDFKEVEAMKARWDRKGGEDLGKMFEKKERSEEDDETDGSEDEEDEEDVEMDEAPPLVRVREPVVPEVDSDGFTKVTKKKR